jgi:hypothetical protein
MITESLYIEVPIEIKITPSESEQDCVSSVLNLLFLEFSMIY